MNRYRQRHPDHAKSAAKSRPDDDSGSNDAELSNAADDVYAEAAKHRETVIAKDKAAKARRKGARRG
jgi:hypothetical protein